MNEHRDRALRGWAKLLNPEALRGNLVAASLFLAAYQVLKSSAIEGVRSFYSNEFKDGQWVPGENYRTKCLALDKSTLRASLLWLRQAAALDDADLALVDRIREHRNELAHELLRFLGTADAEVNVQLLAGIYELVAKIDRWWIREVEMATDPDFDGRQAADEDIASGNMLAIQVMLRVATGEDSGAFWAEFQRQLRAEAEQDPDPG